MTARRLGVAVAAALAALTFAEGRPAAAQDAQQAGGRFRVLIPELVVNGGAKDNFGKDVLKLLRRALNQMETHAPVEEKEIKAALKKFGIKDEDLDCIKSRQLAVQIAAELVMCGAYEPSGTGMSLAVQFIGAKTGDIFEVQPFAVSDPKSAADQITKLFSDYVNQLRLTTFCVDYLQSQQYQSAIEACDKGLAINPKSVMALYTKARALMGMEKLEEAMAIHRQVLEINPTHSDALLTGGILAARLEQPEQSRTFLQQYLELNPASVDVRLKLAGDVAKAGDPEGALRMTEEGLKTDSVSVDLLTFAGHFALGAGQKAVSANKGANGGAETSPEAIALFETALKYYGRLFQIQGAETDPAILKNMILTLASLGRPEEAVKTAQDVLRAKPQDASLWAAYYEALKSADRLEEATAALDSVAAREPNYEQLDAKRALLLLQRGRLADASSWMQRAISKQQISADDAATAIFAFAYNERFRKGQQQEAIEYFEASRQFASTPEGKARANFFIGFALFNRAAKMQEPSTAASARASLPVFQRALQMFEASTAYREQASSIAQLIGNAKQYIERQQALIKQGK